MTIASTRTQEYTMAELCTRAARLAGVLNKHQTLNAATSAQALRALESRLKYLSSKGIQIRQRVFENVQLEADVESYSMPEYVADVYGPAMYIGADQADVDRATSETVITMEPAEDWQVRSSKATTGRPTKYFPYRKSSVIEIRLWPVPSEAGTVRFLVERYPADAVVGSNTADVERPWQLCLEHWIGHDLALEDSKDMKRVLYLRGLAEGYQKDCVAFSVQRGPQQAFLDHDCGYYR